MKIITLIAIHIGFILWFYLGYTFGKQFKNK
jgi:hypothetical protein